MELKKWKVDKMSKTYYVCKYTPIELLQAFGGECENLIQMPEGFDLAVYAAFTDAAGHQQVILAAEIQHKNLFHTGSSSRKVMWSGVASSMTAREWMG